MPDIGRMYLEEAGRTLSGLKRQADSAMEQLSDEQFFAVLDAESNSIAIIVKHMAGNMRSRWTEFLTSDGEKPDRHRDQEFIIPAAASRKEILQTWEEGWKRLLDTLSSLRAEDLVREITIRREPHSVLRAINRTIAHLALHGGQVVFLAKHWKGADWKTLSIPRGQSEAANTTYGRQF